MRRCQRSSALLPHLVSIQQPAARRQVGKTMVWDPYSCFGSEFSVTRPEESCNNVSGRAQDTKCIAGASVLNEIVSLLAETIGGTGISNQRDEGLVVPKAIDDPDEWDDDDDVDPDDEDDDFDDDLDDDDLDDDFDDE